MDKLKYILSLNFDSPFPLENTLARAFVSCLNPQQSVDLLYLVADEQKKLRKIIIKKICTDIAEKFDSCHEQMIDKLMANFEALSFSRKQAFGAMLRALCNFIPIRHQKRVVRFLLQSKYISMRRRGYNIIREENIKFYGNFIKDVWNKFHDEECAWLIVKKFSANYLKDHRHKLMEVLTEPWEISKIYLRIIPSYPELAKELKGIDKISYCYVCAKLHIKISEKSALGILKNNVDNSRLGLLIWCFGQLGLWNVLNYAKENLSEIGRIQRKSMRSV